MDFAFVLLIAFAVFLVVFVRTELGLYLVIFSMLLSPEIGAGNSELAEGRQVVIRTEDLVLLVVAFSWLAKTAVNKELGLALKTPLNRPILWYVAVTTIATLVGYATGTVQGLGGFFYVLKYTEYFVVYYMVANNLSNRSQAWRFVAAPLIGVALLPKAVVNRILYTFEPEAGQATIRFGKLALDPSTSARFISAQQAFVAWTRQPVLGYGVTGARFMDVQYARTLVETGIVGLAVFLWLAWSALKSSLASFRMLRDPEERGLALGFLAGTIGLLVHAVGANTLTIVRIMEPFWFFAAVVVSLPALAAAEASATPARQFRRIA